MTMKTMSKLLILLTATVFVTASFARNTIANYSVKDALTSEQGQQVKFGNNVKVYFGNQSHGKVIQDFGQIKTNKKTNAFMKSDLAACQWVFLSALKNLRNQASRMGANAVINIKSNYKNNLTSSNTQFVCGAGATVAGVALVGDAVKIK